MEFREPIPVTGLMVTVIEFLAGYADETYTPDNCNAYPAKGGCYNIHWDIWQRNLIPFTSPSIYVEWKKDYGHQLLPQKATVRSLR